MADIAGRRRGARSARGRVAGPAAPEPAGPPRTGGRPRRVLTASMIRPRPRRREWLAPSPRVRGSHCGQRSDAPRTCWSFRSPFGLQMRGGGGPGSAYTAFSHADSTRLVVHLQGQQRDLMAVPDGEPGALTVTGGE